MSDTGPTSPHSVTVRKSAMNRTLYSSDAWAAFCSACGKKLSDYDWTAEEARHYGEAALEQHECPRDPALMRPKTRSAT